MLFFFLIRILYFTIESVFQNIVSSHDFLLKAEMRLCINDQRFHSMYQIGFGMTFFRVISFAMWFHLNHSIDFDVRFVIKKKKKILKKVLFPLHYVGFSLAEDRHIECTEDKDNNKSQMIHFT